MNSAYRTPDLAPLIGWCLGRWLFETLFEGSQSTGTDPSFGVLALKPWTTNYHLVLRF